MGEPPTKVEVALTRWAYLVGRPIWPPQGGVEQNLYYYWLLPSPPGRAQLSMHYLVRDAHRAWGEVAVLVRPLEPHLSSWMWMLRVLG